MTEVKRDMASAFAVVISILVARQLQVPWEDKSNSRQCLIQYCGPLQRRGVALESWATRWPPGDLLSGSDSRWGPYLPVLSDSLGL